MTERPAATALDRHRLRWDQFDALAAGGGDAHAVEALLKAERSWRLVQLRAVLDSARTDPDSTGPLSSVDHAWQLLATVDQTARHVVEDLLLHPQVGTWAGYTLRRLRGSTTADAPLWVDVGYLHALAAVAAIRAGVDFAIRIPVRDGFVSLPTLGGSFVPRSSRWSTAEVRSFGGTVTVSGSGANVTLRPARSGDHDWLEPPVIRTAARGLSLSVILEHVDPYRNLRTPLPPDRISPERVERWRMLLTQAWELIDQAGTDLAEVIARGVISVVPRPAAERFRTMSASAGDAFGSMIVSEPEDAPELAVTLVHEFQHIKLGGVLHLVPLYEGELPQRLYAPWRDDPRPLGGLLQGAYAFVGIVEFWRRLRRVASGRAVTLANFEFARWRRQVWRTLRMLENLPQLTNLGRRLVAGLVRTAEPWQEEPVPPEIQRLAESAAADHRARWRLHHLQPSRAAVIALVAAWDAMADRPPLVCPEPVVDTDVAARWLDTRAVLALWRLTDHDKFSQLCRDPLVASRLVSGVTPADLAYALGDLDRAHELFLDELRREPGSPAAWAGLRLLAEGSAAKALHEQPELVRAVYLASGSISDPLALATWLGRGVRLKC